MDLLEKDREKSARAGLTNGFGREIVKAASHYVAPILWGNPCSSAPGFGLRNGSVFFMNCGHIPLATTAAHVYDAYLTAKQRDPEMVCQIGSLRFLPEERFIDKDQRLDVATFRITDEEITRLEKWVYRCDRSKWPPRPPATGKGVFFSGFPFVERKPFGDRSIEFGIYSGILTATSVREDAIVCQFERDEWVDIVGGGLPPRNQWLGGLSGAPLWTLTETAVFSWRLAGIIYEFSQDYELLYVRRPECVSPDGTLL